MALARRTSFDPATIRAHAEQFGVRRFETGFGAIVRETLAAERAC